MQIKTAIDAASSDRRMQGALVALLNETITAVLRQEETAVSFREMAKQLLEQARTLETEAQSNRQQIIDAFLEKGINKMTTGKYRIARCVDGKPTVTVLDEELVNEEYIEYKPRVRKDFVLTYYLQTGKTPMGTQIEQGYHLKIERRRRENV